MRIATCPPRWVRPDISGAATPQLILWRGGGGAILPRFARSLVRWNKPLGKTRSHDTLEDVKMGLMTL